MLSRRLSQRGPFIGLDISSQAVRAAELTVKGGHPTLQRFAQVELPAGAVADGEVVDAIAVGDALKTLWSQGGFSHKRVVVGVSSQRAIVRLADVPAMTDDELRSALKFEAEDLIPIPVEEAVLDFSTVEGRLPLADPSDPPKMRILLAAAQRDMVNGHLAALKASGLKAVAVDPVALALLRAVPSTHAGGVDAETATVAVTEAVIAIGASNTTVAIRENGIARFVRVLNIGGDSLLASTDSEAPATPIGSPSPRPLGVPVATMTTIRAAIGGSTRALVDDIRGSLDFYLAQADTDRVDRIIVTGGAALTEGLLPMLHEALRHSVEVADPLATVAVGKTGLSPEQLQQAVPYLVTPIGLALWGTVAVRPITLLPGEVMEARRQQRRMAAVGIGVLVFAALLGFAWSARSSRVTSVRQQAQAADVRAAQLQSRIAKLSDVTTVQASVKADQQMYTSALTGDVDWVRLIEQVTAVMPADVHLTTIGVSHSAPVTGAAVAVPATTDGTISFAGIARGGPDSVANWLRAIETLPGLTGAWVQTISQTAAPGGRSSPGSGAIFASSAVVTSSAESLRSMQAKVAP